MCRLAGALGLDSLCEQLVAGLASAAGVTAPAAGGSPTEAKQLAALDALVQVVFIDKLQVNACQILVTCCISEVLKPHGGALATCSMLVLTECMHLTSHTCAQRQPPLYCQTVPYITHATCSLILGHPPGC